MLEKAVSIQDIMDTRRRNRYEEATIGIRMLVVTVSYRTESRRITTQMTMGRKIYLEQTSFSERGHDEKHLLIK